MTWFKGLTIFDISRGFIKLLRLMSVYKQSNETSTLKNIGKGHTLTFSLPKRPFAEQPLIDNRNPSEMMQTQNLS